MGNYELVDHTADIGIRVRADSLGRLFEEAAQATFDLIADLEGVSGRKEVKLELESPHLGELLVKWLRELLYLHATQGMIFKEFEVKEINEHYIRAEARGERFDEAKHTLKMEIKSVTYHQLEVKREPEGWRAQVIFDI